jgi:hypothetical protein
MYHVLFTIPALGLAITTLHPGPLVTKEEKKNNVLVDALKLGRICRT